MLYLLYPNKTERSDYMDFSKRLKELRVKNEMSQKQLADLVNLKPSAISKYENGSTQPGIEILDKLTDIFHVSVDYLIGKSSIMNPYTTDHITPKEFDLVVRFRSLSSENKIRIDERINTILDNQIKNK
jgi:transcriptional regulator with XRE-family HTH domain